MIKMSGALYVKVPLCKREKSCNSQVIAESRAISFFSLSLKNQGQVYDDYDQSVLRALVLISFHKVLFDCCPIAALMCWKK